MAKSRVIMRLMSAVLTVLLAVEILPFQTFALSADEKKTSESTISAEDAAANETEELYGGISAKSENETAEIIGEDTSRREENVKHFVLKDGTTKAVVYSGAVHYENDGKLEDIDNSLFYDKESGTYKNQKNKFEIGFSKKLDKENLVTLKKDGYSLSWGYDAGALREVLSKAKVENAPESALDAETAATAKTRAEITYENVKSGTDIEYTVASDVIKENIIVSKKAESYEYDFFLKTEKTTPVLNKDGSVDFLNADGEIVFAMPRPFMYDANNRSSDAVSYSLTEKDGGYVLKVTADSEWINAEERAFPVTVDPAITTKRDKKYIFSSFIASDSEYAGDATLSAKIMLSVGWDSYAYGQTRTLVKFTLPSLNKGDMVVGAQLALAMYHTSFYTVTMADQQLDAHVITSAWEYDKVTWNNRPSFDSVSTDYSYIKQSDTEGAANWKFFEITQAVKSWYEGTVQNNGILIKKHKEGGTYADDCACGYFWSEKFNNEYGAYPYVTIIYRNNKGLEDYWSYTALSADNAGTAYVNDYSGNLVFGLPLMSTVSERAPVSLAGYFNNYCSGEKLVVGKSSSARTSLGKGWRFNIQQTVLPSGKYGLTDTAAENYPYVYADGDGTEHYFIKITENGTTTYEDEDGLGLKLTFGSGDSKYIITDKSDTKLKFNEKGNLVSITDANNNAIKVTYKAANSSESLNAKERIDRVTDGVGHYIQFSYSSDDYVTELRDNAGRKITFTRSSGLLTAVNFPDGTKAYYTYDSAGSLLSAKSNEGYELDFSYNALSKGKRITQVSEKGSGTAGQKITFDRGRHNRTTIKTAGKDGVFGNSDDIYTTYTFDNVGRTVSESSSIGNTKQSVAGVYDYVDQSTASNKNIKAANKISSAAFYGKNVCNILKNGNAESLSSWNNYSIRNPEYTVSHSTAEKLYGAGSIKLQNTAVPVGNARSYILQTPTGLAPNKTYTFSAYFKTTQYTEVAGASTPGVCLAIKYFDSTNGDSEAYFSSSVPGVTDSSINNGWRRLSVSISLPSTSTSVRVYACFEGALGTVYFDGLQLEEGETANNFNMVENSSFEYVTSNMPDSWSRNNISYSISGSNVLNGVVTNTKMDGTKCVKVSGDSKTVKELYQTIPLSGSKTDTYVLSGWAAGYPINGTYRKPAFEIAAFVNYKENSYREKRGTALFNSTATGWQYAAAAFSLQSEKNPTYTPKSITLYVRWTYQTNHVYFDHIQLIKEDVQSCWYNSKGELVKVSASGEQKSNYTYDSNNNLTKYTDSKDYATTLSYDSKHNLTKTVSPRNKATNFTYNSYGQAVSTVISRTGGDNITWKIKTDTSYTAADSASGVQAGAYVKSTSDQHGKTTTYNYNMATGALNSVTDPLGNTTSYERVSAADDRTKKVTSGNSTVSYDYAGTRLNKIIFGTGENSESYSFTYDSFGNVLSTKVGSTALSQSTYGANNGLLQKTQYGNGDSVRYVYNDEGAVSKTLIKPASGSETTQSTALYDSNGRLAVLSDKLTNRRTYYTYDSLGRVLREQFANDSNGNYTGIAEYRYDVRNNLTKLALNFGGRSVSASYTNEKLLDSAGNVTGYTGDYEKGNMPTRFTMYPDRVVNYEYDRLDRMNTRCLITGGVPVYNSYQYYVRQNAPSESNVVYRTTQLIREIVDNTGYTYTYDDVGNILTVKTSQRLYPNTSNVEIGEHSDYRSYSYDNKYQLTRENNVTSGKTTVWGYDGLGNITSKTEYPYTQGALGTALSTVNYTYSNDGKNGWNKLLTAVGNETVTYDAIGNPTSYLGASLSWFGRKLQSYEKGNTNVTYTYDAGGSRASKTVNGTKSEFVYLDGKLVYEKRGGDDIFYLYDSYGSLSNIRWYKSGASSPTNIYVITNRQGDVLGLYDYAGTRKVSYEYDAWGNTVSVTDTSEDCWSTLNPFRYRGYYFDTETGLYYLLSRYYDPAVGRFINADNQIAGVGGDALGYNMFAYCMNNPVNMDDPTGNWPSWSNLLKGSAWLAVGITAVCVGISVLTCGVAAPAMAAVAAVTIGAGALTAVNGAAEIGEAFTGYNVVRDTVFSGNQKAYDTYANATAAVAEVGTMVCGGWLKTNAPRIEAYNNVQNYTYADGAAKHIGGRSYYDSTLLKKEIIKYGKMTNEGGGVYTFRAAGTAFSNVRQTFQSGIWELTAINGKRLIGHFLLRS